MFLCVKIAGREKEYQVNSIDQFNTVSYGDDVKA